MHNQCWWLLKVYSLTECLWNCLCFVIRGSFSQHHIPASGSGWVIPPLQSLEVSINFLLLLLCAKMFFPLWIHLIYEQVFLPFLKCSLFKTSSSDQEQEEPGSAWRQKHCPGWRSSNPFPYIWHYVRICLTQFLGRTRVIMYFALYW